MSSLCGHQFQAGNQEIKCTRPAVIQGWCIIHAPAGAKRPEAVRKALETELEDTRSQVVDLRGGLFADDIFSNLTFDKRVLFDRTYFQRCRMASTTFVDTCSFKNVTFDDGVEWQELRFNKDLIMTGCIMEKGHINFKDLTVLGTFDLHLAASNADIAFKGLNVAGRADLREMRIRDCLIFSSGTRFQGSAAFDDARIGQSVQFSDTVFEGDASLDISAPAQGATFRSVQFLGRTTFSAAMSGSAAPSFVDCNMQGARVLSIPFFSQGTEQVPVFQNCIWPRKRYWGFQGRLYVADEEDGEESLWLLQYYHRFHQQYYNLKDFESATEFYVSYMVTKRKVRKGNIWAKLFDYAYSLLSRYGESIKRPLVPLLSMWVIVPAVLCVLNVVSVDDFKNASGTQYVGPDGPTYWQMFMANLSWTSFDRAGLSKLGAGSVGHAIIFAETLLNILFLAFIALGVRRTFVPKKPLDRA